MEENKRDFDAEAKKVMSHERYNRLKNAIHHLQMVHNFIYEITLMTNYLNYTEAEISSTYLEPQLLNAYNTGERLFDQIIGYYAHHSISDEENQRIGGQFVSQAEMIFKKIYKHKKRTNQRGDLLLPLEIYNLVKTTYILHGGEYFQIEDDKTEDYRAGLIEQILISKKESDDILEEAQNLVPKIKELEAQMEQESGRFATKTYSKIFEDQAGNFAKNAQNWKITGYVALGMFVIVVLLMHLFIPLDLKLSEIGKEGINYAFNYSALVTRVLVFSALIFLITHSFKNFSSNKHQEILNRHRANAMNSYKLFDESFSDSDDNSRNQLLLTLAKSIYENSQSTGYLAEKSSGSSNSFDIVTQVLKGGKSES